MVKLSAAAITAAGAIVDPRSGREGGRPMTLPWAGVGDRLGGRRVSGLPSGVVTFLFTDIEGSTRLVKALREGYREVLAEHRRLVRSAIAGQRGCEVDTQGDAFFAAFAGAKQAVLCALQIQRSLAGHPWPAGVHVQVRIGIHTGHAVPAGGAYVGLAVHRAAWICAAAGGGQVLVSQPTQMIIEDEEDEPGFKLVDLGERRLKDLDRPVRLFQLAAPGLDTRAPTPETLATRPGDSSSIPGATSAVSGAACCHGIAGFTGAGLRGSRKRGQACAADRGGDSANHPRRIPCASSSSHCPPPR
jgi:class 3 adenylate cyclase